MIVSGKYRTRKGHIATVTVGERVYGYVVLSPQNVTIPYLWGLDGRVYDSILTDYDLMEPYVEPVKYSVELYLPGTPQPNPDRKAMVDYLFGTAVWSSVPDTNMKKYKVTVEEVVG